MMQLWFAPTSPFARKTLIVAHELGLAEQMQRIEVDPWADPRLRQLNPLAKVPTLVLDSGEVFFESAVICEYLDSLAQQPRLFPPTPVAARWRALRMQALADGGSAAAGRLFAEERQGAGERSVSVTARFRLAIDGVLDELERGGFDAGLSTIGDIASAAFLSYLDFRWPDRDWRSRCPRLAQVLAIAQHRASMKASDYRPLERAAG